jgi:hypothetical protein
MAVRYKFITGGSAAPEVSDVIWSDDRARSLATSIALLRISRSSVFAFGALIALQDPEEI